MARYTPYRGRRRGAKIFGIIVALLLAALGVVLVLAATQQIVFTPDGPHLASRNSPTPAPSAAGVPAPTPSVEPEFIVETPTATPEPTPEPTPEQPARPARLTAVQLDPRDDVALSGAKQLARDGLINAVMLDLTDEYGGLYWRSTAAAEFGTASYGAVGDASTFSLDEISALHDEGLYVIAQITSFRESYLWFVDPSVAVHWQSGTRWLDRDRRGWLDPYNEKAMSYIAAIALELTEAGADEICLRNFCFPDNGQIELISYDYERENGNRRDGWCEGLLEELLDTLHGVGGDASVTSDTSFVALGTAYTDPACVDEIHAALLLAEGSGENVVLVSSNGRYPASW